MHALLHNNCPHQLLQLKTSLLQGLRRMDTLAAHEALSWVSWPLKTEDKHEVKIRHVRV